MWKTIDQMIYVTFSESGQKVDLDQPSPILIVINPVFAIKMPITDKQRKTDIQSHGNGKERKKQITA